MKSAYKCKLTEGSTHLPFEDFHFRAVKFSTIILFSKGRTSRVPWSTGEGVVLRDEAAPVTTGRAGSTASWPGTPAVENPHDPGTACRYTPARCPGAVELHGMHAGRKG